MIRTVIVAKTEGDADATAGWITKGEKGNFGYERKYEVNGLAATVQANVYWPGAPGAKPICNAVIIFSKTLGDLKDLEEIVKYYAKVPIKFVLYDGAMEDSSFENQWGAKGIKRSNPEELVESIIKDSNDIVKLIANVFKTFDKDKSGFIELTEIKDIAKELGVNLPEAEAELLIKALDKNKDGKISLEEFVEWWKTGREGQTQSLSNIVVGMLKQNKIIASAAGVISKIPGLAQELKEEELNLVKSNFGVFVNRPKTAGLLCEAGLMTKGKVLSQEFNIFSSAVGLNPNEPFFGIALTCKNPFAACETFKGLIENIYMMASGMIPNSEAILSNFDKKFGSIGNKVVMCICQTQTSKPIVEGVMEMAKPFIGFLPLDQLVQLYIVLATDLKKIATESKPVFEFLTEGGSLEVKTQLSYKLEERILTLIKDLQLKELMPPPLRSVLIHVLRGFQWMNGVRGEIEFEIDEELKDIITENIQNTPFAIPLKDLKAMQAPNFKEMINSVPIAEMAHTFFKEEVTGIEFFIYGANVAGIKIALDLPGLGDLINLD